MILFKQILERSRFCLLLLIIQIQIRKAYTTIVVPPDLPEFLSVHYAFMPIINHGTDSRLGFGYRQGHLDFQVQFELGPQKTTQPIGEIMDKDNSRKRKTDTVEDNAASWLQRWADSKRPKRSINNGKSIGKFNNLKQRPNKVEQQLQSIYGITNNSQTMLITTN